eukprot:4935769-Amphidinium_carterae.1
MACSLLCHWNREDIARGAKYSEIFRNNAGVVPFISLTDPRPDQYPPTATLPQSQKCVKHSCACFDSCRMEHEELYANVDDEDEDQN